MMGHECSAKPSAHRRPRRDRGRAGSGLGIGGLIVREPPYDRALALAAQVRTMRDHFLDVSCGCGARRVIALGVMARDPHHATATLAHVALRLECWDCRTGPDEIYLCATIHGRDPPTIGGGDAVWVMALVERGVQPSYWRRQG